MASRASRGAPLPSTATVASDFVQDYATRRQAQLERARQIREERLQQQQQQQQQQQSSQAHGGVAQGAGPVPTTATTSPSPSPASSMTVLQIREEDFKKATRTGIITPDQARQLWAMLSNQAVRVAAASGSQLSAHTASLDALAGLATPFHLSASGAGGAVGPTTVISLESLRHSIAQFKDQQRRESAANAGVDRRAGAAGKRPPSVPHHAPPPPHPHRGYDEAYDEFTAEHDGNGKSVSTEEDPNAFFFREDRTSTSTGAAARARSGSKPEWNFDTTSPATAGAGGGPGDGQGKAGALGRRRTGGATEGAPTKRSTAAVAKSRPEWDTGSGASYDLDEGGGDGRAGGDPREPRRLSGRGHGPAAAAPAMNRPPPGTATSTSSTTTTTTNTMTAGKAGGRRSVGGPPSSLAPSTAVLNLDDIPVGGGGGNFNVSPYAAGERPPMGAGHRHSSTAAAAAAVPQSNEEIAAAAAAAASEPQRPCSICGRCFRQSILARHEKTCAKNETKKRKVFDVQGMRLDGVEGIHEVRRPPPARGGGGGGGGGGERHASGPAASTRMPKWKMQHEQFQAAMRAVAQQRAYEERVKAGGGGTAAYMPPPPPPPAPVPAEYDDRVPCPHCGRKFAENVAERHIPKCATTVAKPKGIRPIRR